MLLFSAVISKNNNLFFISTGTCCNDYKQCVDGVAYSIVYFLYLFDAMINDSPVDKFLFKLFFSIQNCASNLVYDPRTNRCVPNGVRNLFNICYLIEETVHNGP